MVHMVWTNAFHPLTWSDNARPLILIRNHRIFWHDLAKGHYTFSITVSNEAASDIDAQ